MDAARAARPGSDRTALVGQRIKEVREAAGLSQEQLAALLGRTQTAVSYWESGRRIPALDDLVEIANTLDRDVADLLPRGRPTPVKAALRALIEKLDHASLDRQLQRFLDEAETTPAQNPEIVVWEDNPIRAAQQLLSRAQAKKPPVDVIRLAHRCGVNVLSWPFDDALSGLVVDLDSGPVIGVNSDHPESRRRFTIAHELGHFLLRHRDQFYVDLQARPEDGDPPGYHPHHELEANEFAANLLMPAALVRARYGRTSSIDALARMFTVSDLAMRYRLVNLALR